MVRVWCKQPWLMANSFVCSLTVGSCLRLCWSWYQHRDLRQLFQIWGNERSYLQVTQVSIILVYSRTCWKWLFKFLVAYRGIQSLVACKSFGKTSPDWFISKHYPYILWTNAAIHSGNFRLNAQHSPLPISHTEVFARLNFSKCIQVDCT